MALAAKIPLAPGQSREDTKKQAKARKKAAGQRARKKS